MDKIYQLPGDLLGRTAPGFCAGYSKSTAQCR
jgi:hypothetical protein